MYISYFKSPEVFNDPSLRNEVCYIPENIADDDDFYTHNDFLTLCGGKEDLAAQLFDSVNWQHPEVVIDENLQDGLWAVCPRCGNLMIPMISRKCSVQNVTFHFPLVLMSHSDKRRRCLLCLSAVCNATGLAIQTKQKKMGNAPIVHAQDI